MKQAHNPVVRLKDSGMFAGWRKLFAPRIPVLRIGPASLSNWPKFRMFLWGRTRIGVAVSRNLQIRETVFVPRAAKQNAKAAAIYALLPRIPFSLEEIVTTAIRKTSAKGGDAVKMEVIAIPKVQLRNLYWQFQRGGCEVEYFVAENQRGETEPQIAFSPGQLDLPGAFQERVLRQIAVIALVSSLAFSFAFAAHQLNTWSTLQEAYNRSLSNLIVEARSRATASETLLSSNAAMDRRLDRKSYLASRLSGIAGLLDPQSHLERVTYSDNKLTITGLSQNPGRLLKAIAERIPAARAEFVGPLVAEPRSGRERFVIRVSFTRDLTGKPAKLEQG